MSKTWLEAAVNGPWTRKNQPAIPLSPEEIAADCIACARAGAAIVHFHPYDVATGLQVDTTEAYAEVIERALKKRHGCAILCWLRIVCGRGANQWPNQLSKRIKDGGGEPR